MSAANILSWQRPESPPRVSSQRSQRTIVAFQYGLLALSAVDSAGAIYLVLGPGNEVTIAGASPMLTAAALSMTYLLLHQIVSWRYFKSGPFLYRHQKNILRSACLMISRAMVLFWVAAAVPGLVTASKAPFCAANGSEALEGVGIDGCMIQRLSVGGSLLALIVSCIIVYALKTAERPFASSLLGVHVPNHNEEEELNLSTELNSTELSFTVSDNPSEKYLDAPICDPALYVRPPKRPKPPPRGRISWLPPLKFQVPAEIGHPALQRRLDQQTPTRSQTNLLPASVNHPPLAQITTTGARPSLERSETTATSSSSVYSRSTSASTLSRGPSTLSSFPSTLSSSSSKSRSSTKSSASSRPSVPAIPERYRHKSHSLRNGGSPPRPGSRPAMPPANFWMYVRAAQQKQNDLEERSQTVCLEMPSPKRARAHSEGAVKGDQSMLHYPLLPASPEKAVLRPNMNKGNTMRVAKKTSYESLRKGARVAKGVDYGILDGHGRKDSRTLVKMRQPWDQEPRGEKRKANS